MSNPTQIFKLTQDLVQLIKYSSYIPLQTKLQLNKLIQQYYRDFNYDYNKGNYNINADVNLNKLKLLITELTDINNNKQLQKILDDYR